MQLVLELKRKEVVRFGKAEVTVPWIVMLPETIVMLQAALEFALE